MNPILLRRRGGKFKNPLVFSKNYLSIVYTSDKLVTTQNPTTIQENSSTNTNTDTEVVEGEDDTTRTMDVGTLRERLEEAKLGLDGSREMLVTRLREHRQQN